MLGRTAYFGRLDSTDPKPGDTVVVSDNESAMDSVAGQIAALVGGGVIGIAGSDEKVDWLTEGLRFSAAVNNCSADNVGDLIRSACPDGVDIYVDNVGGTVSDGVVERFNIRARLAFHGQIVFYNKDDTPRAPRVSPKTSHRSCERHQLLHPELHPPVRRGHRAVDRAGDGGRKLCTGRPSRTVQRTVRRRFLDYLRDVTSENNWSG